MGIFLTGLIILAFLLCLNCKMAVEVDKYSDRFTYNLVHFFGSMFLGIFGIVGAEMTLGAVEYSKVVEDHKQLVAKYDAKVKEKEPQPAPTVTVTPTPIIKEEPNKVYIDNIYHTVKSFQINYIDGSSFTESFPTRSTIVIQLVRQ